MARRFYPDFFNDVFGPIMQPGSSGGFAGPIRIGNVARALTGGRVTRAQVLVPADYGPLSRLTTFMTDRGYLGGILGFDTCDVRVFDAAEQARATGVSWSFDYAAPGELAPDEKLVRVWGDPAGAQAEEGGAPREGRLVAASVGGGMIDVRSADGFTLGWRGDTYALLLLGDEDVLDAGQVAAFAASLGPALVETRRLERDAAREEPDDAETAVLLELSVGLDAAIVRARFPGATVIMLPPQLPVVTTSARAPQLFTTVPEWEAAGERSGRGFVGAAIDYERAFSGWDEERILARFERIASILHDQIHAFERLGVENVADTPVLPVYGKQWARYVREDGRPLSDGLTAQIIAYAMATNAKIPGVLIVPGPMGTGGGYLYSALEAVQQARGYSHEKLIEGLVVAAGLGALAYTHTNASGDRGCVGESGVCCAMGSGAIAWMAGGTPAQVEAAASMALQASIGITCDPIPGGKEFPCLTRTVRAAVTAPLYADLALAGIDPLIPYHEMLDAIETHYRRTAPELLCGPCAGCNATPTAQACQRWLEGLYGEELGGGR